MKKFLISIYKEGILVIRDVEGVIILFIMPMVLVIVVALLQQKSFQSISEVKIPVALIDCDNNKLGNSLSEGIQKSKMFKTTIISGCDSATVNEIKEKVAKGIYQIGIYIPKNSTEVIEGRALSLMQQLVKTENNELNEALNSQSVIQLYFDPILKHSFRNLAKSEMIRYSLLSEMKIYFESVSSSLNFSEKKTELKFPEKPALKFNETQISEFTSGIIPNSVQHNVPAWILFGMFLICIPIAGNIIKERGTGSLARLKTMPVSYLQIMTGKVIVFSAICLIQAAFMIAIGIFVMPLIDLPQLQISGNISALFIVSLASGFTATGYGILLGSISTTHMQASAFGAISTVIFAAIGGAWIPVIVMPPVMQDISAFSPINWGIHGYSEVFLRNANISQILPDVGKLVIFSAVALAVSVLFRKYNKTM